jgi:hypothetical protein
VVTMMFNHFRSTAVPSAWNALIIKPIYKGGGKDKGAAVNYRPVALIPQLAKAYSKAVLTRLQ